MKDKIMRQNEIEKQEKSIWKLYKIYIKIHSIQF